MRRGQQARADRRERAKELHDERSKRTHQEQIERLDKILGVGVGAVKERARLARLIEEATQGSGKQQKKSKVPKTRSDRRKAKAKKYAERAKQEN